MKHTKRFIFPHNTRFFSADIFGSVLSLLVVIGVVMLVWANITVQMHTKEPYVMTLLPALQSGNAKDAHTNLARWYWDRNLPVRAEEELSMSLGGMRNVPVVLGASDTNKATLEQWEHNEIYLEKTYSYWSAVVKDNPEYIDACLITAGSALSLGYMDEAKSAYARCLTLSPAHPYLTLLKPYLSK